MRRFFLRAIFFLAIFILINIQNYQVNCQTIQTSKTATGTSEQIIKKYYDYIKSKKYQDAYRLISANKNTPSKATYLLHQELSDKIWKSVDFKLKKVKDHTNKTLNNVKYGKVSEYKLTATYCNIIISNSKNEKTTYTRYVVFEKGTWKVYLDKIDISDDYYTLGYYYDQKNDFSQAEKYYLKSIEYNSKNSKSHGALGILYYYHGRYDDAEKYYLKALAVDPKNGDVSYALAYMYYNQERYDEAIKYYNQCKNYYKDVDYRAGVYSGLGYCYFYKHEYKTSKVYFETALKINPNSTYAKHGLEMLKGVD
jgi:tetratricopeptide (TPR) repeat protein